MDEQEVRWEHYPHVATHAAARLFVERLVLKGKRPKTVDAYARAVEDLLTYFEEAHNSRQVLEADEADLDRYLASLRSRAPKRRGRGGMIEDATKIRPLFGRKLSDNTIAQRVVALRLFYDFLARKGLRSDLINPITRGNAGRDGQRPARGPVRKHTRFPLGALR
jgi:integrase/recombinase XerD